MTGMTIELKAAIARLEYVAREEEIPAGLGIGATISEDVAAILAAFEVRPRGTVPAEQISDAETKALSYALDDLEDGADFQDAIDSESIRRVVGYMRSAL